MFCNEKNSGDGAFALYCQRKDTIQKGGVDGSRAENIEVMSDELAKAVRKLGGAQSFCLKIANQVTELWPYLVMALFSYGLI